jgi:predicted component of type VI protein secretion system
MKGTENIDDLIAQVLNSKWLSIDSNKPKKGDIGLIKHRDGIVMAEFFTTTFSEKIYQSPIENTENWVSPVAEYRHKDADGWRAIEWSEKDNCFYRKSGSFIYDFDVKWWIPAIIKNDNKK